MKQFDFAEHLTWSQGFLHEGIEAVLLERIPSAVKVLKANPDSDKSGVDYWVHRDVGRPLGVDVKVRSEDYKANHDKDDLALETWSDLDRKLGWTRDDQKQTDYILWYWTDTGRFCLLPFPALCHVFSRHWQFWARIFKTARQQNDGWISECVYVPRETVLAKIAKWMDGYKPIPTTESLRSNRLF